MMNPSRALVHLVKTDKRLAQDPLTIWLRAHPLQIPLVLPVIVKSTGEFLRLMREYPEASRELRILARQVGEYRLGHYEGRAF